MFDKVLIANRGAIACRIIRTLKKMGIASVAVYTKADAGSLHVTQADEAILIGDGPANTSYLVAEKIIEAALSTGARAIHPGYGFLSENTGFAEACEQAGIVFIGPTPDQVINFGLKHTARQLAQDNGVPLLPGTDLLNDVEQALTEAKHIGFPVMLKSTAGGGGIGMQLCRNEHDLQSAYTSVARLARNNFSNAGIFLEKFVEQARHIEVQIFGDGKGNVIALGERDCSLQRRNQKVVEETPAPNLTNEIRNQLFLCSEKLGKAVNYLNAGTVEFIYDAQTNAFYFLEVNTRLQVEHGVTEEVTGIDLVEWMIKQAANQLAPLENLMPGFKGHAVQVRVYAEDPAKQFQPSTGLITDCHFDSSVRIDTWVETGVEVSPFYDPMLAKVIAHGKDRSSAIAKLSLALGQTQLAGLESNTAYLRQILADPKFLNGEATTSYLNQFAYQASTIDVLQSGTQTTIQDYPGRQGYWSIGIPPSGPMDDYAFRLGNRILGNDEDTASLELTITGPTLKFNCEVVIALVGAPMQAAIDNIPIKFWQPIHVNAGSTLILGAIEGAGTRSYLCIKGGIDVPKYMGSRSTFTLGQFGGHGGRTLQVGDVLHVDGNNDISTCQAFPNNLIPTYTSSWEIKVTYGPHGAPDFFTHEDIKSFFESEWEVHYNSSRTGIRLIGPPPQWARSDGGEAGLHPSNIHDNAYAIGTVDFTGDMPVILGPDGPSLGGFVCPATIITAERWKMGQLRPGNKIRFIPVNQQTANTLEQQQQASIENLQTQVSDTFSIDMGNPIKKIIDKDQHPVGVCYRPSGDKYLLIEYGPLMLDIKLRFRVHALMLKLAELKIQGIKDLTPGIRSLQVHYESLQLPLDELLEILVSLEDELGDVEDLEVPARIVHLPLAWNDSQTQLAIEKYIQSVRKDAPWCPDNIEFIRRINGLDSIEEVKRIVFDASYLVMGLGDVYLGAPVATPLDPRHRLVTTKYNPARTWTPENAVGIGGAYMCVYGMEGPGGYQFVGRTVQMWNRWKQTEDFKQPWLLRFFDQIRFYPVSEEELLQMREDFPRGKLKLKIEETSFKLKDYAAFLDANVDKINAFKTKQQAAFDKEREHWRTLGVDNFSMETDLQDSSEDALILGEHHQVVNSHVHGSVWQIDIKEGDKVEAGQSLMILESMKMEITVHAEKPGTVSHVLCNPGSQVKPGQRLLVIDTQDN